MEDKIVKLCRKSKVSDIDEVKGILTLAVNGIGIVDSQGDRSMSGSFNKTIKENFGRVKWLYNHDTTQLLGCPLFAEEKDGNLMVTGQINLQKQMGRDVLSDYILYANNGKTLEHSIGVQAVKWEMDNEIRNVYEWKWWEYSTLANWGANPQTFLASIKSADAVSINDTIEMLEKALKLNYSDERLDAIEKQIAVLKDTINGKETKTDEPSDDTHKEESVIDNSFFKAMVSIYK